MVATISVQKSRSQSAKAGLILETASTWILVPALFLLTSMASGQLYTGSISGTVKDPSER